VGSSRIVFVVVDERRTLRRSSILRPGPPFFLHHSIALRIPADAVFLSPSALLPPSSPVALRFLPILRRSIGLALPASSFQSLAFVLERSTLFSLLAWFLPRRSSSQLLWRTRNRILSSSSLSSQSLPSSSSPLSITLRLFQHSSSTLPPSSSTSALPSATTFRLSSPVQDVRYLQVNSQRKGRDDAEEDAEEVHQEGRLLGRERRTGKEGTWEEGCCWHDHLECSIVR